MKFEDPFNKLESKKVYRSFLKLKKHLPNFILTGGIATSYYLFNFGIPTQKRKFNDLDVVIDDLNDLQPSVSRDFLISHYHPKNKKRKFHVMLVDKKEAIRVDIFPFLTKAASRVQKAQIDSQNYSMLSLEDLACRMLTNCETFNLDPKYFIDMLSLTAISDKKILREIWSEYARENPSFDDTYNASVSKVKSHPELLKKNIYSQDLNIVCEKCVNSPNFPLASNQEVYNLLGYV